MYDHMNKGTRSMIDTVNGMQWLFLSLSLPVSSSLCPWFFLVALAGDHTEDTIEPLPSQMNQLMWIDEINGTSWVNTSQLSCLFFFFSFFSFFAVSSSLASRTLVEWARTRDDTVTSHHLTQASFATAWTFSCLSQLFFFTCSDFYFHPSLLRVTWFRWFMRHHFSTACSRVQKIKVMYSCNSFSASMDVSSDQVIITILLSFFLSTCITCMKYSYKHKLHSLLMVTVTYFTLFLFFLFLTSFCYHSGQRLHLHPLDSASPLPPLLYTQLNPLHQPLGIKVKSVQRVPNYSPVTLV